MQGTERVRAKNGYLTGGLLYNILIFSEDNNLVS